MSRFEELAEEFEIVNQCGVAYGTIRGVAIEETFGNNWFLTSNCNLNEYDILKNKNTGETIRLLIKNNQCPVPAFRYLPYRMPQ